MTVQDRHQMIKDKKWINADELMRANTALNLQKYKMYWWTNEKVMSQPKTHIIHADEVPNISCDIELQSHRWGRLFKEQQKNETSNQRYSANHGILPAASIYRFGLTTLGSLTWIDDPLHPIDPSNAAALWIRSILIFLPCSLRFLHNLLLDRRFSNRHIPKAFLATRSTLLSQWNVLSTR